MELFQGYAPAKLNLFLHIKEKLSNHYHTIQSFIIFIDLYDKITINKSNNLHLEITGNTSELLKQNINCQHNILIKVVNYLKQQFNINENIVITLEKNIPVAAGLGGGSADAAVLLKLLNNYWKLNLKEEEIASIALNFGADVPSCLHSKSALIEGIGEIVTTIPVNFKLPILLINTLKPLNTKEVYENNKNFHSNHISLPMPEFNNKEDFLNFIKQQTNTLTCSAIQLLPEIKIVLNKLKSSKPIISRMSGSGSTCFAIYSSNEQLNKAERLMKQYFPHYFIKKVNNLTI